MRSAGAGRPAYAAAYRAPQRPSRCRSPSATKKIRSAAWTAQRLAGCATCDPQVARVACNKPCSILPESVCSARCANSQRPGRPASARRARRAHAGGPPRRGKQRGCFVCVLRCSRRCVGLLTPLVTPRRERSRAPLADRAQRFGAVGGHAVNAFDAVGAVGEAPTSSERRLAFLRQASCLTSWTPPLEAEGWRVATGRTCTASQPTPHGWVRVWQGRAWHVGWCTL